MCNLKVNLEVTLHYLSYDKCLNLYVNLWSYFNYLLIMTILMQILELLSIFLMAYVSNSFRIIARWLLLVMWLELTPTKLKAKCFRILCQSLIFIFFLVCLVTLMRIFMEPSLKPPGPLAILVRFYFPTKIMSSWLVLSSVPLKGHAQYRLKALQNCSG